MEEVSKPHLHLEDFILDVPDFPIPGIVFKDICPLLQNADALHLAIDSLLEPFKEAHIDLIVGIESRGFVLGAAAAYALGCGLIMIRKQGKLPGPTIVKSYTLEYNSAALELQKDVLTPGQKVLVVDDVLATGGSAATAAELIEAEGGEVIGFSFLIELPQLGGRKKLGSKPCISMLQY